MKRREFLKHVFTAVGSAGTSSFFGAGSALLSRPARAADSGHTLVIVFLRGGWDGLNVAVPYGDANYYALRPGIAVPRPDSTQTRKALDLNGYFGFHPSMTSLHALYSNGIVAVMPAVHYPNPYQSHFAGQDMIEHSIAGEELTGWLARYLNETPDSGVQRAIALGDVLPRSLAGASTPASAFSDIASLHLASSPDDHAAISTVISDTYRYELPFNNPNSATLQVIGSRFVSNLVELESAANIPVQNNASYPNSNFGRQLRQGASLIKSGVGVELITLTLGGWDTHSQEGGTETTGRMSLLLANFSESVSAFFTDLGSLSGKTTVIAMSEFGRTAAQNGSGGTDHGMATAWMAIGGSVLGGVYSPGGWPGLASTQLVSGRYLEATIDYRSLMAEVLQNRMGVSSVANILPGFDPVKLGIFS